MTKFWHVMATIGMVVATAAIPALRDVVTAHGGAVGLAGAGWAILGNLLKSPIIPQGQ